MCERAADEDSADATEVEVELGCSVRALLDGGKGTLIPTLDES